MCVSIKKQKRKKKTNATFCVESWYSKKLSCVCVSAGACGVSVPHYFYGGGVPEGNSLWLALPPKRLPEERLESAGFHHRSCRVRCNNYYFLLLLQYIVGLCHFGVEEVKWHLHNIIP